jgi:hypothetical protein
VGEATGYQYARKKRDHAEILEAFIAKGAQPWIKTFSDDALACKRLEGWMITTPNYLGTGIAAHHMAQVGSPFRSAAEPTAVLARSLASFANGGRYGDANRYGRDRRQSPRIQP